MRLGSRRASAGRRAVIAVIAAGLLATQAAAVSAQNSRSTIKNFQHVFVIMMENTGFDLLDGNPNAPWTNAAMAKYGLASNSYGVTHPSQPNYAAITAGTTAGFPDDANYTVDETNIVDQLESHGKTWTDYQESLSLCNGDLLAGSCGNQLYERKHNPFVSFADIQSSPARMSHVVDLSQLSADLASGRVADYNFIAPNQCHDMHGRFNPGVGDPCDYGSEPTIISTGDAFLGNLVNEIMSSKAWTGNSVIFITWDESEYTASPTDFGFGDTSGCCTADPGGGHVVTIVISHSDHASRVSDTAYNHYSILSTIQAGWKLGCLGATCDSAVLPMTDLVGPKK
jgi:phospholipase C